MRSKDHALASSSSPGVSAPPAQAHQSCDCGAASRGPEPAVTAELREHVRTQLEQAKRLTEELKAALRASGVSSEGGSE